VHRDLKPENIMFHPSKSSSGLPFVQIIDFGLAACVGRDNKELSSRVGTSYYMAPEVLQRRYSKPCDMWSCGVILYILLSGRPPFTGVNDTEVMKCVGRAKVSFRGRDWEIISDDAKDLIDCLLKKEPSSRLSAAEALSHAWLVRTMKPTTSARCRSSDREGTKC